MFWLSRFWTLQDWMSHILEKQRKVLAATLSDKEFANSDKDQEGNFTAFMAISEENEKDNLI